MITKYVRKLIRAGTHSYTITIPKEIIREMKWRERQKLEVVFDHKKGRLTIKDWEK